MRILSIGDVFGHPAVTAWLPGFRRERYIDFVIANGVSLVGCRK